MHYRTIVSNQKFQEVLETVGEAKFETNSSGSTTWANYFSTVDRATMTKLLNELWPELIGNGGSGLNKGATVLSVSNVWTSRVTGKERTDLAGNKRHHIVSGDTWGLERG